PAPQATATPAAQPPQSSTPQNSPSPVEQPPQPSPSPAPSASPKGQPINDDDVLSVNTDLVNVLFNAVDKDRRFVTTLVRDDVRVYENDVPQEVSLFERETQLPLSLAVLVDVSESQRLTLDDEKIAARQFVDSVLRPGKDRAAIVSFTGTATVEQDLTDDRDALHLAITRVEAVPPAPQQEAAEYKIGEHADVVPERIEEYGLPGSTALWDAVWATSHELMSESPPNARRAIILLTDGDDTSSRVSREDAAAEAVKSNTTVYAIGVEPDCEIGPCPFRTKALRQIAEATGGRSFVPEDQTQLSAAFAEIERELRTQYLVSYTPTNKARDGSWRRIRIEIVNKKLRDEKIKLSYREGYFALPPRTTPPAPRPPEQRLKRPPRKGRKP
ncbi:MAG: VWA domain-containing protein, partial [Acidobacteriota bacterium]|nr:VWA domain-containing protein [Acidobacteriota bacterium]